MKKNQLTTTIMTAFLMMMLQTFNSLAQNCDAGFVFTNPTNGIYVFQDSSWSSSQIDTWTWDFGDGTTGSGPIFTQQYQTSGVYHVCLYIVSGNCTDSVCQFVTVNVSNPCSNLVVNIGQGGVPPTNVLLNANVTGGTQPYTYSWNNGGNQQTIPATANMNYCVTITDAAGCTATACYNYTAGCNLFGTITIDSVNNTLNAVATQGNLPYTYLWSNGATTQSITPTVQGNYCVTITDALGCSVNQCYNYTPQNCGFTFTYTQTSPGNFLFFTNATQGTTVIWNFGDGSPLDTTTSNQINHTYTTTGYYNVCLSSPGCNTTCMMVYAIGAPTSVICGSVFNDANGNSVIDSTESGIGGVYVFVYGAGVQQTAFTDSITGNFSVNVGPGTYYVQVCPSQSGLQNAIITVPVDSNGQASTACGLYYITIQANDTVCGNNFGIFTNASTVSGTLFLDANNNGIKDNGEAGIANQMIQIGSATAYTNSNGFYSIMVPIGSYTITYTPAGFYQSGAITTNNVVANVTQNGQTYPNNNIGLYMPPGQVNLGISINPVTTVTPGFGAWYYIYVCNYGTTPTGATVTMNYDPVLNVNYQSPAGANVNTTNHVITWNIANINPGSCSTIYASFTAQIGIQLGSSTFELVSVTPTNGIDNNMTNNVDTVHQIVVGSWDPNNKLVIVSNTNDPAYQMVSTVNPDQEVTYTINFQNTGNAPAHNVVVVDEMSTNLDINTYEFIGSSHNCIIQRNGHTTTYKFMNIMLPDSTNNEPESHGSITFKVNALSSLNIGDQIIDYTNIYFDFNDPVLTEDAILTIVGPTNALSMLHNETITVGPNPADDFVNVNVTSAVDAQVAITIIDATGKVYAQQQRSIKSGINKLILNTTELSQGIYFVQTRTQDGAVKTAKLSVK